MSQICPFRGLALGFHDLLWYGMMRQKFNYIKTLRDIVRTCLDIMISFPGN